MITKRKSSFWGLSLPTAVGVATAGLGVAAWAAGPYTNAGSDTLGEVAPYTIIQSGANLTYKALGSGTGESNLVAGTQTVAFMSRNFKSSVLTSARSSWQPTPANVLGLDAAVVVTTADATRVQNITMRTAGAPAGKFYPGTDLALILSGLNATGTTADCMAQERLDALDRWSTNSQIDQVDHFYRRNDASGTSDTIRERVLTNATGKGGRFCNGQAPGGLKGDGTFYTNADAEDMDPIRRTCSGFDATNFKATKCIYYPYNVRCDKADGSKPTAASGVSGVPNGTLCTQGLVVAITDGDPDSAFVPGHPTDLHPSATLPVTVSIAKRVEADGSFKTFGYAGREAVKTSWIATAGPAISTSAASRLSFGDDSVRQNIYPLARRLFLNRGFNVTDPLQLAEENKLYTYATGDDGRCNMAPIMTKFGFVSCHLNCDSGTWGSETNLCEDADIPVAEDTMALCVAGGKQVKAQTDICCATNAACSADVLSPDDGVHGCKNTTFCPNPVGQVGP
jgi:hypothetical protein